MRIRFALIAALFACGCDTPEPTPVREPAEAELLEVYELFRIHQAEHNKPPRGLRDLNKYAPGMDLGFNALQTKRVVAVWDAAPGEESDELLAYEKDAPLSGGWVVRRDGRAEKLSPDQAKAALAH